MSKLEKRIHDEKNGLDYVLVGDYYIPALIFPEGRRHIGKWGRMHRAYLKEHHPNRYNALLLSGKLGTYLADLDEQAQVRFETIVRQIKAVEQKMMIKYQRTSSMAKAFLNLPNRIR